MPLDLKVNRIRVAAIGLFALFNTGCGGSVGDGSAGLSNPKIAPVARVTVVKAERMTIRRVSEEPGQIEGAETTPIHAKLAGYVEKISVDIGDVVKQGQVLAELRVPEILADLNQKKAMIDEARSDRTRDEAMVQVSEAGVFSAEAKLTESKAGIRRAEADVARWRAEATRIDQLVRERAQTGSLLDETRNKLRAAESTLEEVQAHVRSGEALLAEAKAHRDKARADLQSAIAHIEVARFEAERAEALASYARIVAPFDGVIIKRSVDTGHLTTPGADGQSLFVIMRAGIVTISLGVPEIDAPFVNLGDKALLRLPGIDTKTYEGTVTRTAWALEAASRTLRVEVDLPNPDNALRPGLYAYVSIILDEHKDVLTVPLTAVITEAGRSTCMVVRDGKVERREIKVGISDGKRVEVISGLAQTEEVVEANAGSLVDGQAVEPVAPPAKPKP